MHDPLRPDARRAINQFGILAFLTLAPSLAVFGWRAIAVVVCVVAAHAIASALLRKLRMPEARWTTVLPVDALLLACLLPADAASPTQWPWLVIAGGTLALLRRLRLAVPGAPFDPAIVTILLLHGAIFASGGALAPHVVLQRSELFKGDVMRAVTTPIGADPWYKRPIEEEEPALRTPWAAGALDDYLRGPVMPGDRGNSSLDGLVRDRLPPLEDLVLLGHPMPLGQASGIFLIGVILWGAYRRIIDWRIPLIAGATAYAALILLAVPTSVSSEGGNWRFLAAARTDVGPATALTFSHFVAFASPMTLALGLFAPRLDTRPLRSGAMIVWAAVIGVLGAASALYASVAIGPLVVVAFAPLSARIADRWIARRPMRLPE